MFKLTKKISNVWNKNNPNSNYNKLLSQANSGDSDAMCEIGKLYVEGSEIGQDYNLGMEWFQKSADLDNSVAKSSIEELFGNANAMLEIGILYCNRKKSIDKDYTIAIDWFKKSADVGNYNAMFVLGVFHIQGYGVDQNNVIANEWFQKAIDANDSDVAENMGDALYSITKDYAIVMDCCKQCADLDNSHATLEIGKLYENGHGVEQDYIIALEWYKKSADLGNAIAESNIEEILVNTEVMEKLGEFYLTSKKAVGKDYTIAVDWFQKSADLGNWLAMGVLGLFYIKGYGVDKNDVIAYDWFNKAVDTEDSDVMDNIVYSVASITKDWAIVADWCEKSADLGNYEAMLGIGGLYANGYGVEQDYTIAMDWYQKSFALGNSSAKDSIEGCNMKSYDMRDKGLSYIEKGVNQNYTMAMDWFKKSVALGNIESMRHIGELYENGHGVEQDYVIAMDWYKKSLNAMELYLNGTRNPQTYVILWFQQSAGYDNSKSMNNIGRLYESGYGVDQDYTIAMDWYKKSADLGNSYAMLYIGGLYENGYGVDQDYNIAMNWYKKSADLGNSNAMANIGILYDQGEGVGQDYDLAMKWYKKSAKLDNSNAMKNIGILYYNGEGVDQDYDQAIKWYQKSANLGNSHAMYIMGILYENGHGVEANRDIALGWYKKSASLGNLNAISEIIEMGDSLIKMSFFGIGESAQELPITEMKDATSPLELISFFKNMYTYDETDEKENRFSQACSYYKHAIEFNNTEAMLKLGLVYYAKSDLDETKKWINQSISLGNNLAIGLLCAIYIIEEDTLEGLLSLIKEFISENNLNTVTVFSNLIKMFENDSEEDELFASLIIKCASEIADAT